MQSTKRKSLWSSGIIAVAVILLMALSACSASSTAKKAEEVVAKDPFTLFSDANKNMDEQEGVKQNMAISGTMKVAGQEQPIQMSGTVLMNKPYSSAMEMSMDLSTEVLGQSVTTSGYYKDGYLYSSTMGQKTKTKTDMDQLRAQTGIAQFAKSAIIDQKSSKTAEGTALDFTVKGDALKEYALSSLQGLEESSSIQYSFQDVKVHAIVADDGTLKSYEMTMPFSVTVSGQAVEANMTIAVDDITYGKQNIVAPSDLDTYQETSASTAG